jgi:hypothetical protein
MSSTYTWANAEETSIVAIVDGVTLFIPADPANTDYARLVADGTPIDPYVPPAAQEANATDVKKR